MDTPAQKQFLDVINPGMVVLRNHQRPAFESLIHKVEVRRGMNGGDSVVRTEANRLATQWFSDPASGHQGDV